MEITNTTRKAVAGLAAVVLTLAAAGAAVAVNLGSGTELDSPAGKLVATEPVDVTTSTAATPSTIYVDVTVPLPQAPVTQATTGPAVGSSDSGVSTPSPAPSGPVYADADDDDGDDDDSDDRYEDDDRDGDREDDRDDEAEDHEDGADDDD